MPRAGLIVALLVAAALFAGSMPYGLALACIPQAAPAAPPCDQGGCDEPEAPGIACICIHYPAPQAPGSLAVLGAAAPAIALAAMPVAPLPAPAALPTRDDPPDPPPPR